LYTPHVIVSTAGAQPDTNVVPVNLFGYLESLEAKASAILNATAPIISTFVGCAVEELSDEITISAMNYTTTAISIILWCLVDICIYVPSMPSKPAAFALIAACLYWLMTTRGSGSSVGLIEKGT
jgi:uncharacterized membrane protein YoaK (UPF0700 family)